jgi:1,4-alpha-glucan branching enzyme
MTAGRTRLTGYGSSDTSISESYYSTYLDKYMEVIGNDYDFLQFDMYPLADNTKKNDIYVALNMVPQPLEGYEMPVYELGTYKIVFNTDDMCHGGS